MRKEIVLPPHLYDRIRASAGEHGGIGANSFFDGRSGSEGVPMCAHGHAWGTCTRMQAWIRLNGKESLGFVEPELAVFLKWFENDAALNVAGVRHRERVSFEHWCELLNVKRGDAEATSPAQTGLATTTAGAGMSPAQAKDITALEELK